MLQSQVLRLVEQRLRRDSLPVNFEFWNGKALKLSDSPTVTVNVRSPRGLSSLIRPTLGKFARNYVEQHIDLVGGAREIIRLGESLCQASSRIARKSWFSLNWRSHNRSADRRAISYHYDVSNEFYGLWLDRNRVYSCAYFR
ncbi:MAG: class I SAM-dependent methyltransferase, partial [Betaproteobacteria bacterium]